MGLFLTASPTLSSLHGAVQPCSPFLLLRYHRHYQDLATVADLQQISSVLLPLAKSTFSSKIFGLKQRATIIIAACLLTPHVAAIVTGIWQIQKSHSEAVWALPAGCHLISAVFSGIVARKTKWSLAIVCGIHAAVNLVVFGCSVGFLGELLAGKSCPFFELQCTFCIIPVMSKIVLKTFVVPFLKKIEQRKSDIGFPGMSIGKDKVHDSGNNGSRTAEDQSTIVV